MATLLGIRKCDNCGQDVEIYHKERLDRKNIFCSKKCESEYKRSENINYTCVVCGKLIHKKPSQITKSKTGQLCCSTKCMGELRKTMYLGEDNPNYGNRGELNPNYLGREERINVQGYRLIRLHEYHPFAIDDDWIREHRYIAEKYLMTDEQSVEIDGKRYLSPEFDVHHIDFDKLNNKPENLQIMTRSDHMKYHQNPFKYVNELNTKK